VQLRSAKQGHVSYRHIAQQVFKAVERVHPLLAKYIRVDLDDYDLARLQVCSPPSDCLDSARRALPVLRSPAGRWPASRREITGRNAP
jgi:thymidylate synthase ThyX